MKFCIAVLLLSSLYLASSQTANPWVLIRHAFAANSPFSDQFNSIGGQNNLGQAADSRLFADRQGEAGDSSHSYFQAANGSAFNYSSELPLTLGDAKVNSEYKIRVDPETGAREIIGWSFEHLFERDNQPAGRNISYDIDSGHVVVTEFEGIDQWIAYQLGNASQLGNVSELGNSSLLNVTTYENLRDYHHNFIGYEEHDPETYTADEVLDNAFNNAIRIIDDTTSLDNINVTNVRTVDSYVDEAGAIWVRVDADITTDTDNGEIVTVTSCDAGSDCSDGTLQYWWWKSVILG